MDLSRLKIDPRHKANAQPGWRRSLFPALLVLLVAAAAWLIAGDRLAGLVRRVAGASGIVVETVTVQRLQAAQGDELTTASGYVVARQSASLGSKVLGRLAKLYVEPGDRVRVGQVLAELEHEDLDAAAKAGRADRDRARSELDEARQQTALARLAARSAAAAVAAARELEAEAEARLADAARELARAEGLVEGGTGSEKERDRWKTEQRAWAARHRSLVASRREAELAVDSAQQRVTLAEATEKVRQAFLEAAEARLEQAEANRDDAFIRAPFAGVILRKEAEVGEIVAPSPGGSTLSRSAVLTMANFGTLELEVDVFERDIHLIRERAPAQIRLDAYPNEPRLGHVRLIRPTADRQKATVQVKVTFAEIPDFARPEMAGTVVFLREDAAARAEERTRVLVPARAVVRDGGKNRVWIVRGDEAYPVEVRLGPATGGDVEVLEGLTGGERVIVTRIEDLKAGQAVSTAKRGGT